MLQFVVCIEDLSLSLSLAQLVRTRLVRTVAGSRLRERLVHSSIKK